MSDKDVAFTISAETVALIEEMKGPLGAHSTAEVFRRCLALAKVAVKNRRDDGTITITGRGEVPHDITLHQ